MIARNIAVLACRIAVAAIAFVSLEVGGQRSQLPGPVRTENPVEAGTGGTLVVVAPENLCQPDLELMVARTILTVEDDDMFSRHQSSHPRVA
jgi:hypothetical protein